MAGELGKIFISIMGDTKDFNASLASVQKKLENAGRNMRNVGKKMSMFVTAPIVGVGVGVLKAASDFEFSMNRIQAITGAAGEDFEALENQAKELGRTTQFSASQAAEAMNFLGMAGFDTNEILGAMPGTLELAATASMDLGSAADIVSNILTGFGINVDDLSHVNDVLAQTMTSTNTDLNMLGESFKYVGPIASGAGLTIEETAAAIGMMGNAGIQGSMAGTSLRQAISRLLTPSDEATEIMNELGIKVLDADGNLRSMEDIIRQLEDSGASTAEIMQIFGQRAGPAMAALVKQGADSFADLRDSLENADGTAKRMADVTMQGLRGEFKAFMSAIEGLALAIAESGLLEWATNFVGKAAELIRNLSEANPILFKVGIIVAGVAAAIGPLLIVLGQMITAISAIAPVVTALQPIIMGAMGPAGWMILAITAAAAAALLIIKNWDEVKAFLKEVLEKIAGFFQTYLVDKFNTIVEKIKGAIGKVKGFFQDLFDFTVGESIIPEMVEEISKWFGKLGDNMKNKTSDAVETMMEEYGKLKWYQKILADSFADSWEAIWTTTGDTTKKIKEAVKDLIASVLTGLAKKYSALAAMFTVTLQWGKAVKYAAASAGLFLAAQGIRALQEGAIVQKPVMAMVGEGQASEAVIPLTEKSFEGLAEGIVSRLEARRGAISRPVTLNIGTLVADEYGLKKLERKLRDIRIQENIRFGERG